MPRSPAPRRDFATLTRRRRRAVRLFAADKMTQAEIARQLGASRQSVSRWYEAWQRDQPGWIAGAGRAGPQPKLDKRQLKSLDKALRQGAPAHGFGTALWTLPRVATLIERLMGVSYHPGHVWKILGAMNWTLQRPAKQAREHNEKARLEWVAERWPAIKKKPGVERLGSFSKTKAASPSGRR